MLFGHEIPSVYSQTPMGIMLLGSIHRMRNNLNYLSDYTECECRSCAVDAETGEGSPIAEDVTYQ